jgi:hypothetical protein
MRTVMAVGLLFFGLLSANAQSPIIERIDNIRPGIVSQNDFKTIKDKNVSTGERLEGKSRVVEVTKNIVAAPNGVTVFGVEFDVIGTPTGTKVPVRAVWRYPEPGLKSRETGTTKFTDEIADTRTLGETNVVYFWRLADAAFFLAGIWTFELWQGDRKLMAQEFVLTQGKSLPVPRQP